MAKVFLIRVDNSLDCEGYPDVRGVYSDFNKAQDALKIVHREYGHTVPFRLRHTNDITSVKLDNYTEAYIEPWELDKNMADQS